jgi:Uma2 family endonuclease
MVKKEIITNLSQLDVNGTYSYEDYVSWKLTEMVELIKGKLFMYSPAPKTYHQAISFNLNTEIGLYLKGKLCKAFSAPFDVRLVKPGNETLDEKIWTVVQPDICVICDRSKIDERGCIGSPDIIVEITSPATAKKDLNEKYNLYEQNGVAEYWVVFAEAKYLNQYVLTKEGVYQLHQTVFVTDYISSTVFPDLIISGKDIFNF